MKLYKHRKSNIHRHGLSSAVNIKKNQRIIQYKGKKVSFHKVEIDPKIIIFMIILRINACFFFTVIHLRTTYVIRAVVYDS